MMKTILMVIVFFSFIVDLMEMPAGSPSPSVIWLRNGVLIDSDYTRWIKTDGFGLYQVDKMVINPLGAAEPPPSNITIAGLKNQIYLIWLRHDILIDPEIYQVDKMVINPL